MIFSGTGIFFLLMILLVLGIIFNVWLFASDRKYVGIASSLVCLFLLLALGWHFLKPLPDAELEQLRSTENECVIRKLLNVSERIRPVDILDARAACKDAQDIQRQREKLDLKR